jgi:hypothetical protein
MPETASAAARRVDLDVLTKSSSLASSSSSALGRLCFLGVLRLGVVIVVSFEVLATEAFQLRRRNGFPRFGCLPGADMAGFGGSRRS